MFAWKVDVFLTSIVRSTEPFRLCEASKNVVYTHIYAIRIILEQKKNQKKKIDFGRSFPDFVSGFFLSFFLFFFCHD